MSIEKIVAEAIDNNPLKLKEAFEEEMSLRLRAALEEKYKKMMAKESDCEDEDEDDDDDDDDDEDEDDDLDEGWTGLDEETMTVDIDHTGGHDSHAKKHGITLKKTGHTDYSHNATGKKKNLQKYLAKHYDSHDDAKDNHPEVYK